MLGRNLMVFFLRSPASGSACCPRFSTISSFFTRHSWQDLMCWHGYSGWNSEIQSAMSIGHLPLATFHWHFPTSWGHQHQYISIYFPCKPGGPSSLASQPWSRSCFTSWRSFTAFRHPVDLNHARAFCRDEKWLPNSRKPSAQTSSNSAFTLRPCTVHNRAPWPTCFSCNNSL